MTNAGPDVEPPFGEQVITDSKDTTRATHLLLSASPSHEEGCQQPNSRIWKKPPQVAPKFLKAQKIAAGEITVREQENADSWAKVKGESFIRGKLDRHKVTEYDTEEIPFADLVYSAVKCGRNFRTTNVKKEDETDDREDSEINKVKSSSSKLLPQHALALLHETEEGKFCIKNPPRSGHDPFRRRWITAMHDKELRSAFNEVLKKFLIKYFFEKDEQFRACFTRDRREAEEEEGKEQSESNKISSRGTMVDGSPIPDLSSSIIYQVIIIYSFLLLLL